ncbi:hypothetical protein SAMN06297387_101193 [Streptomyces zhaozhouensis]|uniref:Uncharacterized protein n=1 Tax=Streptomyces zhaozhouensis TaxID=1300267 RepID=A0A286DIP7_9ACTN|nr:hypothetical protein [Streptomyces zhaozhouensis]SOD58528.1 hypothetical protein SAMN06297387_101193 [Streptomyces zhaozhouensis]
MRNKMIVPTVAVAGLLLVGCGSDSDDSDESQPNDPSRSAPDESGDDAGSPPEDGDGGQDDEDADAGSTEGGGEDGADTGGDAGEADAAAFDARAREVAESWPEPLPPAEPAEQLASVTGMLPAESTNEELTVEIGHGQCDADFGAWVAETDELVIVGGWAEPDPSVDMCAEVMVMDEAPVELEAELGDRTVVDAATGEELTVVEQDAG